MFWLVGNRTVGAKTSQNEYLTPMLVSVVCDEITINDEKVNIQVVNLSAEAF